MIFKEVHIELYESGGSFFIIINDEKYKCPYSEYAILRILVENKGSFYSNEQLMAAGWPERIVSPNSVPVAITNLRKIFKNHTSGMIIENIKNKGYIINSPQVIFASGLSDGSNEVHSSYENVSITNQNRKYINRFLRYPLFIINIILVIYLIYAKFDFTGHVENEVEVASDDSAVIISPKGTNIGKISSVIESKEVINFSDIKEELDKLEHLNKSIVFFSDYGRKIIIDCVVGDDLYSYSGNDLKKILSDLNKKGCKI